MHYLLLFNSLQEIDTQLILNQPIKKRIETFVFCVVKRGEQLIVFEDECPHLGESLSKGKVNYLGEIVCPWHTYRFSLQTGEETSGKRCRGLRKYPLVIGENGEVYVVIQ